MKKAMLLILGAGVVSALGLYVSRPKAHATPSATVTESLPEVREEQAEPETAPPVVEPPAQNVMRATPARLTQPVAAQSAAALDAGSLKRTLELLVSPQVAYPEKRAMWRQLREAGKLDPAIADLEQRLTNEPRSAEIAAALGQAYLQKCASMQDVREQGILAMQADKVFDTALSADPANWEARFTKAVAMSYWPPVLNKTEEVIQHFETLVQQQETQNPQPQFADTYLWLGQQYQKAGRADDARATWQRGSALFPDHEPLRAKLAAGS
jgi:tetratricopeptide (TPR) repeat protein